MSDPMGVRAKDLKPGDTINVCSSDGDRGTKLKPEQVDRIEHRDKLYITVYFSGDTHITVPSEWTFEMVAVSHSPGA